MNYLTKGVLQSNRSELVLKNKRQCLISFLNICPLKLQITVIFDNSRSL